MNYIIKTVFILLISISTLQAQLIINELSQGTSGAQEYVEFLVIGSPSCSSSTVDLRGWIIDDNNSWHAPGSGNGIASGHKRFSSAAQWANIRMGSLIVIYNESDVNPAIPADDPSDSNHDCIYILPSSSSLLDHNVTMPTTTLTFSTYLGSPYTAAGNWNSLSMNNTNDAFHTVNPSSITRPYHAIGWGTNLDSNTVYFPGGMGNRIVRFMNTIDDNAFNPANFLKDSIWLGSPFESPGQPNSLANTAYINYLKNSCLPFSSINIIVDTSICAGGAVFAGGSLRTVAGTYYDTIAGGVGCDTIKRTNLSIAVNPVVNQTQSICFGETVIIAGIPRTTPGLYRDTLTSLSGCDSIVNTTLRVDTVKIFSRNISICNGDSYFAGGANQTLAGNYYDSLIATSGCDSVLTTILRVNNSSIQIITNSICAGNCINFAGINRCVAGSYFDTLINYLGCDSILRLDLTILSSSSANLNITRCSNENYTLGSNTYTVAGIYHDTITNFNGCDSIITLNLSFQPISSKIIDTTLCQGNSLHVGSAIHTTTGTFYDTLTNYTGCDSIVRSNILVINTSSTRNISICNGDSIFVGGANRTTTGSYYDTLVGIAGCDSVLRTNLTVNPSNSIIVNQSICIGDDYLGVYYTNDTTWSTNSNNRFGCDSTYTLNLTVNPVPIITIGADTCIKSGESITLTASGGFDYFWSNGTNNASITISPTVTSSYFVQGLNIELCSGYDTITICVNENIDSSYFAIPNAFTPNGDGLNDLFKVLVTSNLDLESMQIFNRWGELIYNSNSITNGWDGNFNDRQQPQGTYVYYIQLRNTVSNKIEKHTGTVTLIR